MTLDNPETSLPVLGGRPLRLFLRRGNVLTYWRARSSSVPFPRETTYEPVDFYMWQSLARQRRRLGRPLETFPSAVPLTQCLSRHRWMFLNVWLNIAEVILGNISQRVLHRVAIVHKREAGLKRYIYIFCTNTLFCLMEQIQHGNRTGCVERTAQKLDFRTFLYYLKWERWL